MLIADITPTDLTGIPVQYQVYVLYFVVGLKIVGELIAAIRNGGGLRRIFLSIWFGENVPKVVAEEVQRKESEAKHPVSQP